MRNGLSTSGVRLFALCVIIHSAMAASAAEKPRPIPIGLDAYRAWDRWPEQRIGMRTYMRSTYDRNGGNEGADASHFLYQLSDKFNVTLDVEGSGLLLFSRYNHCTGAPGTTLLTGKITLLKRPAPPTHCILL